MMRESTEEQYYVQTHKSYRHIHVMICGNNKYLTVTWPKLVGLENLLEIINYIKHT